MSPRRRGLWHGMLCPETRDEITDRMQEVLGDNYFTVVQCNSWDDDSEAFVTVEVRSSEWLAGPVRDYMDPEVCGLSWRTPAWSFGVHTTATTLDEAREGTPHQWVRFKIDHTRGLIEIDHYAPSGYRLRWIFSVEHHDRDDIPSGASRIPANAVEVAREELADLRKWTGAEQ